MCDPADIFGSIILDNSPIKEDSDKLSCQLQKRTSVPTPQSKKTFSQEVSLVAQGSPLTSPPAILLSNHLDKALKPQPKETTTENKDKDNNQQYEFGKSMYDYAKKFDNNKRNEKCVNNREIPVSKSEGDLQGKKSLVNNLSNSHNQHLNKSHHHHHHQHQCCSGFGAANRHRFQSNACVIN